MKIVWEYMSRKQYCIVKLKKIAKITLKNVYVWDTWISDKLDMWKNKNYTRLYKPNIEQICRSTMAITFFDSLKLI